MHTYKLPAISSYPYRNVILVIFISEKYTDMKTKWYQIISFGDDGIHA